jgi:signal transduction histidine kinase
LQAAINELGQAAANCIDLELAGCIERLDGLVATEIFYVLQEALANGVRHSGASRILVVAEASEEGLNGAVTDDGCGMVQAIIDKGKAGHWGLTGMRERMLRLGGTLTIDSAPGAGTAVKFSVPAQVAFGVTRNANT